MSRLMRQLNKKRVLALRRLLWAVAQAAVKRQQLQWRVFLAGTRKQAKGATGA
jgi:hypothetical protein